MVVSTLVIQGIFDPQKNSWPGSKTGIVIDPLLLFEQLADGIHVHPPGGQYADVARRDLDQPCPAHGLQLAPGNGEVLAKIHP